MRKLHVRTSAAMVGVSLLTGLTENVCLGLVVFILVRPLFERDQRVGRDFAASPPRPNVKKPLGQKPRGPAHVSRA